MAPSIRTAFHEATAGRGGTHVDEGGWFWCAGFGDPAGEYAAVRDDVAVWDVSPLNKWEFRGRDAMRAAQYLFSNDFLGTVSGQARYGAFLDADGLVVDDGTVYNLGRDDRCWVMTNGRDREDYFASLLGAFDVEWEWKTQQMPNLGIVGPRSRDLVRSLTDADVDALKYFRFFPEPVTVGGVEVILSRTGFGGELGFELFLTDPADATELYATVVGAGARPFGVTVIEPLRVEAGLIVTGYDYAEHERTPYDLGLDRLVALGSDVDFAGKSRLAGVASAPPNRFVTLRIDGETLPAYGAEVRAGGAVVGVLTSPADSPRLGLLGMAIVRTEHASLGARVAVELPDGETTATVDALPIYDHDKRRPRA